MLNDKTLGFAITYTIVISLSLINLGFIAILMIDFFVRFKVSRKVTLIMTRPIFKLFLLVAL
jgi:hypothetical protein